MFEVHKSKHSPFRLKITVGCPRCCGVLCVHEGVVLCGVWCGVVSICVVFFSLFSQFSSFSFLLSLSFFSLLSSLFSSLFSSSFSLSFLLATKHYGKNRSTNTAANIKAFECDLAQGKCTAVGSLPPPFSPSPPQKKKEETFYYRNISGEGIILHYSYILIQKNRRRVKLQSLNFYLNSKKSTPGEITVITVLY